jgi:enoyl-[acyl-carrier-protein] reductase (NADH)
MKKVFLIIGGAGRLGSELVNFFSKEYLILSVDIEKNDFPWDGTSTLEISPLRSHWLEDFKKINEEIKKIGELSAIIFANRIRLPRDSRPLNFGEKETYESEIYFAAELIECLLEEQNLNNHSSIIFITSTNAKTISHQPLYYHLAKASIDMMIYWLADRLKNKSIRVNGIRIGLVGDLGLSSGARAVLAEKVLLNNRITNATDICKAVNFLVKNDLSTHLTGQILNISGGYELEDPLYLLNKIGIN